MREPRRPGRHEAWALNSAVGFDAAVRTRARWIYLRRRRRSGTGRRAGSGVGVIVVAVRSKSGGGWIDRGGRGPRPRNECLPATITMQQPRGTILCLTPLTELIPLQLKLRECSQDDHLNAERLWMFESTS